MMGSRSQQQLEWLNKRDHSQKIWAANLSKVAFVPVKDLPSGSKQNPDERLGDMTFKNKYWESTIKDYTIEPGTPESSDRDSDADSKADKSVDLNATNAQHDVDNQFLSEELIYNGETDLELFEEEEDDEADQNQANCGEDVLFSDACDPHNRR
ncbi:hypothetical protein O181_017934 [Austropuccinia psidii MF-1]|uniref:Uncharacterized protein n=1 Tax=Austropuccinia psidii MF-1 TaxID=1389203 RepID=A0A9Q3C6N8_9BASI|nr:hypothetical protein [Austropuccinia psidii MF-1]